MKRLIVAAVLAAVAFVGTPTAVAAPGVTAGAGMTYAARAFPGAQLARCTIGAVGTDAAGRKLGLTAGHCGPAGATVYTADGRTRIGRVVTSTRFPGEGVFVFNVLDYAFIQFDNNVRLVVLPNPAGRLRSIAPPRVGTTVCKYGNGFGDPGERCGVVDRVGAPEFSALLFGSFGDSGGPVYSGSRLIGVLSRPSGVPFVSGVIMTRADSAIANARRTGRIGGTFRLLG